MNDEFLDLYNQLDSLLRYIVNNQSVKNYISYYEVTLPFDKRRLLEEIRHFKNNHKSHGVSNEDQPIAPKSWNVFLRKQINYVQSHKEETRKRVSNAINGPRHYSKESHNHYISSTQHSSNESSQKQPEKIIDYTPYPEAKFGYSIDRFTFSKNGLDPHTLFDGICRVLNPISTSEVDFDDIDTLDKYEKILFSKIINAINEYEGFDGNVGKFEVNIRRETFNHGASEYYNKQPPLPKGTIVNAFRYRYNDNYVFEFCFNTVGPIAGSVIFTVWEKENSYSDNYLGKPHGLYYFVTTFETNYERTKITDDHRRIEKVLAGKKVVLNVE